MNADTNPCNAMNALTRDNASRIVAAARVTGKTGGGHTGE